MSDDRPPDETGEHGRDEDDWAEDDWDDDGWSEHEALHTGTEPGWEDGSQDTEWVELRPPMSGRKRLLIGLGSVVAVVLVAVGVGVVWLERQIDPPGSPGAELELEVAPGSTTEDIGELLADHDVITSSLVWNYWTRFNDEGPFLAGVYVFRESSSFQDAVAVLDAGPRPPENVRVTIPEGLTVGEILGRIADPDTGVERWTVEATDTALASGDIRSRFQPADQPSMEGLLFPETYEVGDDTDERTFLRRLVTELDETLVALDVEARAAAFGLTPYEIVIVASLIEEEARVPGDRAKISRVIHNRLEQGIPLGIDATSRYEAEIEGRGRDELDFDSDSPYNTRRVTGLPPTPIASPGRASLEAALDPEPGDWIYYVLADAEGNHTFAETAREFERAKQECIRKNLGCG